MTLNESIKDAGTLEIERVFVFHFIVFMFQMLPVSRTNLRCLACYYGLLFCKKDRLALFIFSIFASNSNWFYCIVSTI